MVMVYRVNTSAYQRAQKAKTVARKLEGRIKRLQAVRMNPRSGGFIGKELKYKDEYNTATALAVGNTWYHTLAASANAIAQGTGNEERLGLRAVCTSLRIAGVVSFSGLTGDRLQAVTMYLILDTQTNGSVMTAGAPFAWTGNLAFQSPMDLTETTRYKILKKYVVMPKHAGQTATAAGVLESVPFSINVNLKNLKTKYLGTGALTTDIADNSIHLVACTNSADVPQILLGSRIRFYAD